MANDITLHTLDGMMHLRTTYATDLGGLVTLDIPLPNANHPILMLQAMACEFAAAHLTRRAEWFRRQNEAESPAMEP